MKKPYEQWKREVDLAVEAKCGLSSDDLPDYDYRSAYDSGESPKSTAAAVIRAAKDF